MFERGRLFVLIVLLTSFGSVAAGASPTASPETPPADPCATAVPALPNDLTSAFAYEIQSVSLLHFLSQIKRVPERDQKEVFDNVAAAAKTAGRHELEVAEQSVCPNLEQIYGQTRALILVANEWTPRELHDDDKFSEFAQLVGDAVTALVFGDKLTDDQRRLALRPFGSPAETGASLQSDGTTGRPCLQPVESARTLHAVPPNYPALAGVSGTTGRVEVLVS